MRAALLVLILSACKEPEAPAYCQEGSGSCFRSRAECANEDLTRACHPVEKPWIIRWLDRAGKTREKILSGMDACEPAAEYMRQVGNAFLECVPL